MLVFRIYSFQGIEGKGEIEIGRIEVNDIVHAVVRDVAQYLLHRLTVRIDERYTVTSQNVLHDHVLDHRGFSHSGLADDVHVPSSIVLFYAKSHLLVPEVRFGEYVDVLWLAHTAIGSSGGGWTLVTSTFSILGTLTSVCGK